MRTIRVMFVRTFGCLWIAWSSLVGVLAFLILSSGFFLRALMRGDGGSTPVAALWALAASPFLPVMATLVTMRLVADERADGRLEFSFGFTDRDSALGWILSFGPAAELLEPETLRRWRCICLCRFLCCRSARRRCQGTCRSWRFCLRWRRCCSRWRPGARSAFARAPAVGMLRSPP